MPVQTTAVLPVRPFQVSKDTHYRFLTFITLASLARPSFVTEATAVETQQSQTSYSTVARGPRHSVASAPTVAAMVDALTAAAQPLAAYTRQLRAEHGLPGCLFWLMTLDINFTSSQGTPPATYEETQSLGQLVNQPSTMEQDQLASESHMISEPPSPMSLHATSEPLAPNRVTTGQASNGEWADLVGNDEPHSAEPAPSMGIIRNGGQFFNRVRFCSLRSPK